MATVEDDDVESGAPGRMKVARSAPEEDVAEAEAPGRLSAARSAPEEDVAEAPGRQSAARSAPEEDVAEAEAPGRLSAARSAPEDDVAEAEAPARLSAAQRARMERARQRARALRDARLVQRPHTDGASTRAADTGGGFLAPEAAAPAPRACPPPAPVLDPAERPRCLHCDRLFPQSYLFDAFGHHVCDECRDDDGSHALITRTEAKSAYLLKDCDLDLRAPALRCVRRRNPHGARLGDMRLYLRAQVAARALEAWGSEEAMEAERARRGEARARGRHAAAARRLRALRMDVRSSLFAPARAAHAHEFGAEQYDAAADQYSRACACGHRETYEKM